MTGAILKDFVALRPFGGFGLIMADPPWRFENYSAAGEGRNPSAHYSCEGLDWIKALPVQALAADDCLLWLWATNPMLPQALEVIAAWGFEFKTAGTWVKRTKHGKDSFGTGYLLRSANEPFLLATRGAPKTTRSTRSVIPSYDHPGETAQDFPIETITMEAALREHSRKPEVAFKAAEDLMPSAPRLELFSRQTRVGWSGWGNEIEKFSPEEVS